MAVFLLLCAGLIAWFGAVLPPDWDPRVPLDVRAAPNPMTRFKLRLARGDAALCRAALASSGLPVTPVPDRMEGGGCGLTGAVRVAGADPATSPATFLASCPLALDWAMFVTHEVQPTARAMFGQPVARIEHLGSYACRPIRNDTRISTHATADAVDVAAFVLQGGRRISVARDWGREGSEAAFLRAIRNGGCRYFGAVLGPDYNALHADHFHMQATGWGLCR